jgi:hypothetical protein
MAYMLPPERYPDVRRVLDPTLGEDALPSDIISSDIYQGEAERWVVSLDPAALTRTGSEQEAIHRAIIHKIASMLSPRIPQARQINMAGHTATFTFGETVSERTARLLSEATAYLATYITFVETIDVTNATVFVVTVSGRRG